MLTDEVVTKVCRIATSCAMNGHPLANIKWLPPQTATADPMGVFVVEYAQPHTAAEQPIWEK